MIKVFPEKRWFLPASDPPKSSRSSKRHLRLIFSIEKRRYSYPAGFKLTAEGFPDLRSVSNSNSIF